MTELFEKLKMISKSHLTQSRVLKIDYQMWSKTPFWSAVQLCLISVLSSNCEISTLSFWQRFLLINTSEIAKFAVDDIQNIKWQSEALSNLQISEKKKRTIHALLKAHMKRASFNFCLFDNLIVEKGLRFNVLL